jgi:hypothetical protein
LAAGVAACDDEKSGGSTEDAGRGKEQATGEATNPLSKRCEQLGQKCGQKDKHKETIRNECKEAANKQVREGCVEKVVATYDCYEKELCVEGAKIWALDDFRVLTERHGKCGEERKASNACVAGIDEK